MPDEFQGDGDAPRPFSPSIALVTLSRIVDVRLGALLESHGLTLRTYAVLGHIAATPGISPSDLSRRSRLPAPSVQPLIRSLVDAGFVRSATQGRALPAHVTVTREGSALLERVGAELARFDAETFAPPGWRSLADALTDVGFSARD